MGQPLAAGHGAWSLHLGLGSWGSLVCVGMTPSPPQALDTRGALEPVRGTRGSPMTDFLSASGEHSQPLRDVAPVQHSGMFMEHLLCVWGTVLGAVQTSANTA